MCTHPVLSGPAYERIADSALTELVVTDSIPLRDDKPTDKITVLGCSDLFSTVIRCLVQNESISSHFLIT